MKKFFKDWGNLLSFSVALIPAMLLYVFPPNKTVPYSVLIIIALVLTISVWLNLKLFLDTKDQCDYPVIPIIECSNNRCICKTDGLLSHDSVVSIYRKDSLCTTLIGYGLVETTTTHKVAQVIVKSTNDEIEDLLSYINDHKDNIIINPVVTLKTISEIESIFGGNYL